VGYRRHEDDRELAFLVVPRMPIEIVEVEVIDLVDEIKCVVSFGVGRCSRTKPILVEPIGGATKSAKKPCRVIRRPDAKVFVWYMCWCQIEAKKNSPSLNIDKVYPCDIYVAL
jgi:hypothetical protein